MDLTQMPVSPEYKYLQVMIDTFTGWIESFPTQTEKAEEVVKTKQKQTTKKNCSIKSFQDLVCPGHYKVMVGHHLLLRSPRGSLNIRHYLLSPLCLEASVFRKRRKSQPILKITNKKDNSGYLLGMEGGFTNSSPPHQYCP